VRGRLLVCNAPGARFGLRLGLEKAAFVKTRARDREVAQRCSLGSSVARQEGRRLRTQHHLELSSATEVCVTRYRSATDLVTKTVNNGRRPLFFTVVSFGGRSTSGYAREGVLLWRRSRPRAQVRRAALRYQLFNCVARTMPPPAFYKRKTYFGHATTRSTMSSPQRPQKCEGSARC
jgi:hypothetical protein